MNSKPDKKERYKYVHIFQCQTMSFNLNLVELLCDPNNDFNIDDQLFVTRFQPLYEAVKNKCHIKYYEISHPDDVDVVNRYGDCAEWLIVHSFPRDISRLIFQVKKEYLRKIIWRTWGHDVCRDLGFHSQNVVKNSILQIYYVLYYRPARIMRAKKRLQNLGGLGIGSIIDTINVKESYGVSLAKTYFLPYPGRDDSEILKKISNESRDNGYESQGDGYYHVMVGHCGYDKDRHCQVIDILRKYEKEKIMLHIPLSYGDEDYIRNVKRYIKEFWHGKIEFLEEPLDFEEYARWMNKMDAVILDATSSTALGNLYMVLFLKKKLFLNRNGILQKGLLAENLHFHYTDEISDISFEEFGKKEQYDISKSSTFSLRTYEQCVDDWKRLFKDLDNEYKKR